MPKKITQNTSSEAENLVSKERVTRPLSWRINDPCMVDGSVAVAVYYYVHNGSKTEKGKQGQMEFYYPSEEFSSILRQVSKLDAFRQVNELGKISSIRDKQFNELNLILCNAYDCNPKTDRLAIYEDVQRMLFHDTECRERFRKMVKAETLLNLMKRPAVFYSEELQTLFT